MSILIKGMEMPKDGRLLISIHPDGCVYRSVYDMGFEKMDHAAAKELLSHGRLIDADALLNDKGVAQIIQSDKFYHEAAIQYAPTIVEAEVEE